MSKLPAVLKRHSSQSEAPGSTLLTQINRVTGSQAPVQAPGPSGSRFWGGIAHGHGFGMEKGNSR